MIMLQHQQLKVDNSGAVTGVAAGNDTIKATITGKDEIDANVIVTVTAAQYGKRRMSLQYI